MCKCSVSVAAFGVVIAALLYGPAQAELITSAPGGSVTTDTGMLGVSTSGPSWATDSWGQIVKVPASNTTLDSFSFWLTRVNDLHADDGLLSFRAYVMKWNAATTRATGSILYQSDTQIGPASITTRSKYTWSTGGINLTADEDYVLFLSVYGEENLHDWQRVYMGYQYYNVYADGVMVTQDKENNYTTETWSAVTSGGDLAFDAVFSPEPASSALLALGAVGLLVCPWRKRSRR